ncbi:hypothetical protein GPM19_09145 [Halomonas sp. ZH2S]|uniref:Uncharacterized protein n=1 Tax=Vreelandella zhuhanensis TaxID=2684210 RepID=A0A7X3H0Y5_9GAMM|nr:hypothetical protein [Halomonas zhuhanensis]MWJ28369.1 hypothetical protein [Halomonas zhuhanensis]
MQSKYKISLLRGNLLAAAATMAFWTQTAMPQAAALLWLSVGWLLVMALLLEFSHRRSRGLPWQLFPGLLLMALISVAPERHAILVWAWVAILMLPQPTWALAFNLGAASISLLIVKPTLGIPTWALLVASLGVLTLLALSRARQMTNMNGAIRQRLRLIPGYNLWPGEQLLRDLPREQVRCERESVHGELLVLQVKRHQLWSIARKLSELTYDFENVYRLDGTTLATLLLAPSPQEAATRRILLLAPLPDTIVSQRYPLMEVEPQSLSLASLCQASLLLSSAPSAEDIL